MKGDLYHIKKGVLSNTIYVSQVYVHITGPTCSSQSPSYPMSRLLPCAARITTRYTTRALAKAPEKPLSWAALIYITGMDLNLQCHLLRCVPQFCDLGNYYSYIFYCQKDNISLSLSLL